MTLTITDATMTSDQTAHTARLAPGSQHLWEVSWLPGCSRPLRMRMQGPGCVADGADGV